MDISKIEGPPPGETPEQKKARIKRKLAGRKADLDLVQIDKPETGKDPTAPHYRPTALDNLPLRDPGAPDYR